MLRKIELAATTAATVFAVGALLDLILEGVGKLDPTTVSGGAFPLSDLPFAPVISGTITFVVAALLVVATIMAQTSVLSSVVASDNPDRSRLDHWRRMTWGASIVETAGCLLFIFSGTLLFLPSALALLLVGVTELATIWRDMEGRAGHPVQRVVPNGQHTHP